MGLSKIFKKYLHHRWINSSIQRIPSSSFTGTLYAYVKSNKKITLSQFRKRNHIQNPVKEYAMEYIILNRLRYLNFAKKLLKNSKGSLC